MSAASPDRTALVPADGLQLVLSTAPPGRARELAATLVGEGLAACANLVPGLRSLFIWEGELRDEPETLLILKVASDRLERLSARCAELHPYDVPELLVFSPSQGLEPYLTWATTPATESPGAAGRPGSD